MRFDLSQSGLKSVITAGIFSLVAIGILLNWAVPVSAQNAAPAKPDTPTLRALDQGMVEVDWNDVSGANRYEVQFYTSSGWIDLPNAGLGIEIVFDGSRAVATGLPADLGYDAFHVRAGNSVGWSEWSEYAWQMTTHNMDWEGIPATGAPTISGTAQVGETLTAETSGIADADGLTNVSYRYQWIRNDGSSDTDIENATRRTYTLVAADEEQTIKVKVSFTDDEGNEETLTSAATDAVAPVPCPGADYNRTPTDVEVDAVPIVVTSTTDDYFVLYVSPREVELPVLVKRGEAGTTTLAENVEALPAERYRVEKYLIADPADVDGDCIDDITELDDFGTNNPVNAASSPDLNDGAVGIPDRAAFEVLARNGKNMKFVVFGLHTRSPRMYFQNTNTHPTTHNTFLEVLLDEGLEQDIVGETRGYIDYHPSVEAADGSPGVYVAWDVRTHSFRDVSILHTLLAANMLLLEQDLVYLFKNDQLLQIQHQLRRYEKSRIPLVFDYDLWPEADFVPLNEEVGFGLLRVLEPDERPSLRDVVIYEALPNNLPRVAGIISTVPQTPLSHVNLRAIQDGVPNAFIRDALDNDDIESLIGGYVRYAVNETRYSIRAATREEVDAYYDSSRPSQPQTPQRDLSVTEITQLSEIGFDDWDAFGVKAANVAVLRTLGFPEGTIPDGFAIPFYFYDEFMKHNDFYTRIETMLADADFQEDFDTQDEELKDLRDAIEDGETPAWILTALADMNTGFPEGTTNRKYRSSTNNEDLPGFNGAGLYDSKSQKPDEDEEDGLDKSLKEVYASLWNFRAFTERDFHRIDHLTAAMGILVHPSYQDELVNGVAVSFDPIGGVSEGDYYVNSQLGEDLVTNPDAHSVPEELVLYLNQDGRYRILATSNQVAPGELLMSNVQIDQLRRHLKVIHDHFAGLYNPAADEPFAMEIEFKITSENKLAIKQARPWVFSGAATPAPGKTLPSAPINLAVAPGDTSLTVVWDQPANTGGENPTGYDVRYIMTSEDETDDANWTEQLGAWTESSGVRSYTITGLETGVQYDVQVRAENSVGKGPWSATEAGTPQEADVPSVTANFEQSSYNVTEGGDVSIAVMLSADPERSVAIPITTTNQGTATDADYSGVPLEVTFESGDTEVTFTFTATDDPVDDDGEWVKVTFGALPAGVSEGTTTEATVSITDNDVSGVTVSETALTVPEGGTAGETYTVVLDSPPTADVVVTVAGHAGTEVTPSPTSLTFTTSNWNDAHTVTVKAGDDADTLDDTVTLTHMAQSTDSNYEGITIDGVAVTVNDDDTTNTPATGAPTIRGTVQVGETLTAYTAGITDDDGLNNVSYSHQWIRNDGTSDTEIQDATGETYPLVDADEGKTIKVKVSFTDDADNEEALTSTATAEVAAAAPTEPPGRPRNLTGAANADGTVTLSWDAPNDDTVTGYQILRRKPREGEKTLLVHVNDTGSTATQHTDRDVTPDVGHAYRVKAINAVGLSRWSNFVNVTPVQPAEPAQNSPATGRPTISGTVQVGETLTVDTSGISDADGLTNATFTYQWMRNDGNSDTDIAEETGPTYTLVIADLGKTIQVQVSFTDDEGDSESLTSAATVVVAARPNIPATGLPIISGTARVGETLTADTSGIGNANGLTSTTFSYQWTANEGGTDKDILDATSMSYTVADADVGRTIGVRVSFTADGGNRETLTSASTTLVVNRGMCTEDDLEPAPVDLGVADVPIVVESTSNEYFVLYVRHDLDEDTTLEIPVSVTLGLDGTTTLSENVAALPAERYRVEKYLIAYPGDVDCDSIDDITELADPVGMNPVNSVGAIDLRDGAVAIPDQDIFETLTRIQDWSIFKNKPFLKFALFGLDTDRPGLYFINTQTRPQHSEFLGDFLDSHADSTSVISGQIGYDPELIAPDGRQGLYWYSTGSRGYWSGDSGYYNHQSFSHMALVYTLMAANMPLLDNNLSYYITNYTLPDYQPYLPSYWESRINLLFDEDIFGESNFIALNSGEGYGLLRLMESDDRPSPRDIVIYETLPNELSRVAGIMTTVPQTPLSHVNLRAVQDGLPNAFLRDALDNTDVANLIGTYVHYTVTEEGWTLRPATPAEVDAHYTASRPAIKQIPQRDLTVTQITSLSDIRFEDWDAFGVKAANVAVLGSLDFPAGTVPDGFAMPFYFYDEFMKANELYDDIKEMLADEEFQSNFEVQEDELKKLRKKIKKATTPNWMITALEEMHRGFTEGTSLRYRSSTNNEDLPGFNGAGLYDSNTQHPEETEEDGIAKSLKQVYASLWNFRAFTEREFHRIDHLAAAMGVLVHPNYSDELANGVAVSFDPIFDEDGSYYVNTQIGEDLVTNPDAYSVPEEILLHADGKYTVAALSNQVPPGQLLMSDAQLDQLRLHLVVIHDQFAELYNPATDEPFAMEIEFKITSDNVLSIKQARPWVFEGVAAKPNSPATGTPSISGTVQVGDTLTADTAGIGDADGLTNVAFSYQWIASDGVADIDIISATDSSYTLVDADAGLTINVKVSFTDDAGNGETVTSAATSTVAARTNSAATGAPTISGTVQVGETLTADTSTVSDDDGLTNVSYSYQWIRNDGSTDTDIQDATGSTYTLVDADEGQTIKVRVTFTDDVGHDETLTSASTAAIAAEDPQSQEPPAKPTGLTATVSHDSVSLTWDDPGDESITGYQILRRDRALHAIGEFLVHVDDTGNANTTFTDNDVEPSVQYVYRIKAKNNAGLSELSEWVRANMPAPTPDPNSPATGVPTVTGTAQVGEVLTADTSGIADADGLENATFSYQWIRNDGSTETDIQDATGSIYTLVDADEGQTIKVKVSFTDDAGNEETLTSTATGSIAARPNTSATGRPTISGTARVGDTLTADTTGIADADGLTNVSYSYQWVANDGTSDADIGGATGSTYTLTASEQGQTIRVRVSFTDDAGNETTLTSAATEAVAARPNTSATGRPTISGPARVGETLTVDTSGIADADGLENATFSYQWVGNDGSADTDITGATDTSYTLVADDVGQTIKVRVSFSDDAGNETTLTSTATEAVAARPNTSATGRPSISGTVRAGEVLTADTSGIADDDGLTNVSYGYQWVAGGTDLGGATGSTYTLTASEQGKTIRVRVSFTDDAGNQESLTSAATDEVAVRPNSPATGQPIISGTVRVGDMLTADTSGIADADGLDNVSYRYQWVVTDRGAYFDISGETGATYTLVAADRGLYIQVRVSFTDDAGKRETLTSALTDVVAAAP